MKTRVAERAAGPHGAMRLAAVRGLGRARRTSSASALCPDARSSPCRARVNALASPVLAWHPRVREQCSNDHDRETVATFGTQFLTKVFALFSPPSFSDSSSLRRPRPIADLVPLRLPTSSRLARRSYPSLVWPPSSVVNFRHGLARSRPAHAGRDHRRPLSRGGATPDCPSRSFPRRCRCRPARQVPRRQVCVRSRSLFVFRAQAPISDLHPSARSTVAAAGGSAVQTPRNAAGAANGAGAGAGGRRAGGRGRRGAGGAGRRGAGEERPTATAESLDAEMSDWQAQAASTGNGAAAAEAPAA